MLAWKGAVGRSVKRLTVKADLLSSFPQNVLYSFRFHVTILAVASSESGGLRSLGEALVSLLGRPSRRPACRRRSGRRLPDGFRSANRFSKRLFLYQAR